MNRNQAMSWAIETMPGNSSTEQYIEAAEKFLLYLEAKTEAKTKPETSRTNSRGKLDDLHDAWFHVQHEDFLTAKEAVTLAERLLKRGNSTLQDAISRLGCFRGRFPHKSLSQLILRTRDSHFEVERSGEKDIRFRPRRLP